MIPFFDLSRQHNHLQQPMEQAFQRVVMRSRFIMGEELGEFQRLFAEYLGVTHCVGCGNGTDALELALGVAGIVAGDEVIVPANTWVSVAEAVLRAGGVPVFADSLPGEYTIDPASVVRCITPRTRALIVVHQYGLPARLDELLPIRDSHQLTLIEDCAHAHGAEYGGKKAGTWGDFGCFSFYPTKNLGCLGDGGAVVTNKDWHAEKLRLTVNHGQPVRDVHQMAGRNSRLDELQAALLNVKLRHLGGWNSRRKSIAAMYTEGLDKSLYSTPFFLEHSDHVFHQYAIQTDDRAGLARHLEQHAIQTAIHYPHPIHKMAPYSSFPVDPEGLTVAESESRRLLSLPIFPELTDEEVRSVVRVLNQFRG